MRTVYITDESQRYESRNSIVRIHPTHPDFKDRLKDYWRVVHAYKGLVPFESKKKKYRHPDYCDTPNRYERSEKDMLVGFRIVTDDFHVEFNMPQRFKADMKIHSFSHTINHEYVGWEEREYTITEGTSGPLNMWSKFSFMSMEVFAEYLEVIRAHQMDDDVLEYCI